MSPSARLNSYAWIVTLCMAGVFFCWAQGRRAAEVDFVTSLGAEPAALDAGSPTGYAGGVRQLLAPGHNNESYQWIAQTQQMIAQRAWRLRQVDYDNAPAGRVVLTPSPYRWWLAVVAWMDHALSGRPIGLSVERAALWADPLLFVVFLVGATVIVARRMGGWVAVMLPLALVAVYPFAGGFLPGCPDDNGLAVLLGATAALLLLAGLQGRNPAAPALGWFVASGIAGGLGLWVNVGFVAPVLAGLALGAAAEAWVNRREVSPARPWRAWAVAGATSVIAGWLIEYAPHHLGLEPARLTEIHPWYALTWLGGGEILCRLARRLRGQPPGRGDRLAWLLAVGAIAVVPVIMVVKKVPAFLAPDAFVLRLTALGENTEAGNWATWLAKEGASLRLLAMLVPLGLLGLALMRLWSAATPAATRSGIALLLGPVAVSLGLACTRLSWWNQADVLLLLLFVAAGAGAVQGASGRWPVVVAILALLPGAAVLVPPPPIHSLEQLTRHQKEAVVERNFAQWLARRTGPDGAIVLAPPAMTASLYFHGGLRGLGSPYRENADGFRASVRLAGATSADEAQALARQRKLTHIAIPSWDDFLEEYARLGADQPEHTLTGLLHAWLPPRWLRPVPYYLPEVAGFEDDRLVLFEVTEPQDQAAALSRLTEYFLDMGQVELASLVARTLATDYGSDLGARVALARTELARKDRAAFAQSLDVLAKGLQDGSGETLAWDRRVSLAVILAEGGREEEAKVQVQRCLEEMGELDVRGLSQATLYRFLVIAKNLGLRVEDATLRNLARSLLPVRYQSRV